jgi:two-component system, chemotaxis family, chemotaxis protein CheY
MKMAKKILVVDDSAVMRSTVVYTLKDGGYETVEAGHGKEALQRLEEHDIGLIFCDVNMPIMNGLEFANTYRNNPRHKFIPIVMLTTESGASMVEQGKAAGVKAWMVKPFEKSQLLLAASKLFR